MEDVLIIHRRKIEAMILRHVYDVLKRNYSVERARELIGEAVSNSAIEQGTTLAKKLGRKPDFFDFKEILQLWMADGALEIDDAKASETSLQFNVLRCAYYEMYKEMGLEEIADILSCNRDGSFCKGYNSDMKLTRRSTIARGATACDFAYKYKT